MLVLMFIGLLVFLAAFVVPIAIIVSNNFRERVFQTLGSVPGFKSGSRWKAAGTSFIVLILAGFILAVAGAPADTGGQAGAPTATPTATPTPTPTATPTPTPIETLTDREIAEKAARSGLEEGSMYTADDPVREIDTMNLYGGGYTVEVRYNLAPGGFGGSIEENAEEFAARVAMEVIGNVVESEAQNVSRIDIYAYVPVRSGGETVSSKIIMGYGTANRINWGAYRWEDIREDAEQYKFNAYLYN